jgi:hypothetical protein
VRAYTDLADKIKELAKMLSGQSLPPLPEGITRECLDSVTGVISKLRAYLPPTAKEKSEAKNHSLSAQIVNFTTMDAERKRFFNLGYFRQKFQALPADRKTISPTTPTTLPALRDAIILYHYRLGHQHGYQELAALWHEIEDDYKNSPAVRKVAEANELFSDLLGEHELKRIVASLEKAYPAESDLKNFAKMTKLKIPVQSRSKGAPKKTIFERLADQIYMQGGPVRMRLD